MRELKTEITIEAPVSIVWKRLMNTESYKEWNPFVAKLEGNKTPGSTLDILLTPPGGSDFPIQPQVVACNDDKEFRWRGKLWMKGLFDGEHIFELEATEENQTRFVHREEFSGILVWLVMAMVGKSTMAGFLAMNEALKQRAEQDWKEQLRV